MKLFTLTIKAPKKRVPMQRLQSTIPSKKHYKRQKHKNYE
jgi:hypothetical protein